jgi:type VI protein secretion system component Hcp
MAGDDNTDMLMMFVYQGDGVPAEGQSDTTQEDLDGDTLMDGFEVGKFFEVESVDLGFSKSDKTSRGGAPDKSVDGGEVRVTRQIDAASPSLMKYCYNSSTLDSATIVKRRAGGGGVSGFGYLRLEFTGVLITGVSWSDSHVVKETISFIYRKVQIFYRPQSASGQLGVSINASWALFC